MPRVPAGALQATAPGVPVLNRLLDQRETHRKALEKREKRQKNTWFRIQTSPIRNGKHERKHEKTIENLWFSSDHRPFDLFLHREIHPKCMGGARARAERGRDSRGSGRAPGHCPARLATCPPAPRVVTTHTNSLYLRDNIVFYDLGDINALLLITDRM